MDRQTRTPAPCGQRIAFMATAAPCRSLADLVRESDIDGLAAFITERYDTFVLDEHVVDMLDDLAMSGESHEHYLECRLRKRMRELDYFTRMLGEPELYDTHHVWNRLHWPWSSTVADGATDADFVKFWLSIDPQYVRSRLPNALIEIQPVNQTACKVARPPRVSRWLPCLNGESVIVADSVTIRNAAYQYAKKHGMRATVATLDGERIEVRFVEARN